MFSQENLNLIYRTTLLTPRRGTWIKFKCNNNIRKYEPPGFLEKKTSS